MSTLRILLVEDNPADTALFTDTLHEDDIDVATSLRAAIAKLANTGYDAIVLDLGLPDADGLEGLGLIRDAEPDTPVVVLSGSTFYGLGDAAVRLGAQDYLVKGVVSKDAIRRALRYAIERHTVLKVADDTSRDLQLLRRQLDVVMDMAPQPMLVLDVEGRAVEANDAFYEWSGRSVTKVTGRMVLDELVDPASEATLANTLSSGLFDGGATSAALVWHGTDGTTTAPVEVRAVMRPDGAVQNLIAVVHTPVSTTHDSDA